MKIWIDADSCPRMVRDFVVSYAERLKIKTFFVANKQISAKNSAFEMVVCDEKKDAADNYIFENAKIGDIVITRDILLAERLVEKKVCVINDRGKSWTRENIKESVSDRNFDYELSLIGLASHKKKTYNKKDFEKFANCFDREVHKAMREKGD